MSIRFPKHCKTRAQKSEHASRVATIGWERRHAAKAGESIRAIRPLIRLDIQRIGIDPAPVPITIMHDGLHSRKLVIESDRQWERRYGRKALVAWFNSVLKSAGV
jgi:hypothetical protein